MLGLKKFLLYLNRKEKLKLIKFELLDMMCKMWLSIYKIFI